MNSVNWVVLRKCLNQVRISLIHMKTRWKNGGVRLNVPSIGILMLMYDHSQAQSGVCPCHPSGRFPSSFSCSLKEWVWRTTELNVYLFLGWILALTWVIHLLNEYTIYALLLFIHTVELLYWKIYPLYSCNHDVLRTLYNYFFKLRIASMSQTCLLSQSHLLAANSHFKKKMQTVIPMIPYWIFSTFLCILIIFGGYFLAFNGLACFTRPCHHKPDICTRTTQHNMNFSQRANLLMHSHEGPSIDFVATDGTI